MAHASIATRVAGATLACTIVLGTSVLGTSVRAQDPARALPQTSSASPFAFRHVSIVDVRGGATHSDMTVLVVGDRISAVGPSATTPLPKHTRVLDGRGEFLIPGLWDMHVHSDGDARTLQLMLASGITGVRDMAGDVAKLTATRNRITSGDLVGPHLLIAGPRLVGPPADSDSDLWIIGSPDEARRAVDSLAAWKVDFIKVHDGLARDTYIAIAEAAKARGLPFVGHVSASMTPAEASDLGQKSIEHLEFLPKPCLALVDPEARAAHRIPPGCDPESLDALLQRFARNGTWLDPTIQSFRYFAPTRWEAIFTGFRDIAKQIRENHVSVLAGTDWSSYLGEKGAPLGGSLHDELALLVEAGFTPREVLRAATLSPAVFFGMSDSLGTIEPGKVADIVLLEANPLADIHNTRRVVAVMSEGRLLPVGRGVTRALSRP